MHSATRKSHKHHYTTGRSETFRSARSIETNVDTSGDASQHVTVINEAAVGGTNMTN